MPKKVKKQVKPVKKTKAVKKPVKNKKIVKKAKVIKKGKPVKAAKKPIKAKVAKTRKITKTTKKTKKVKKVTAVAKGYHSITPYLIVHNAAEAITFYKNAFGAKEVFRMEKDGGKVGHAELDIGGSKIMLADAYPELNACSPKDIGATPVAIHLYIANVDGVVAKAIECGAKLLRDVETMYYGDRSGGVEDPFGHQWYISTHVEDVKPAEIKKRLEKLAQQNG